jgi:hypothetical protein
MEKEDLTKLYAKRKWLQKSSSFLNQIILSKSKKLKITRGYG